jgi:putative transposase
MADHGIVYSMSRSGNVWDNAAMKSSSHRPRQRGRRKTCHMRDEAKADVVGYIEGF